MPLVFGNSHLQSKIDDPGMHAGETARLLKTMLCLKAQDPTQIKSSGPFSGPYRYRLSLTEKVTLSFLHLSSDAAPFEHLHTSLRRVFWETTAAGNLCASKSGGVVVGSRGRQGEAWPLAIMGLGFIGFRV